MATDHSTLILGPADHGRLVSAGEFAEASRVEPWKYERVDGRLAVMHPDCEAHDDCSEPMRDQLGAYKIAHPEVVEKVVSEAWVEVSASTTRIGDIAVYLRPPEGTSPPRRPARIPEIMVEVVSESASDRRRDYVEKKAEYYRIGVREYVVVDRFDRSMTVFSREPGGYSERILKEGDAYETPFLPGLRIALEDVF